MTPAAALPRVKPRRVPFWLFGAFVATGLGTVLGLTLDQPLMAVAVPLIAAGAWALFQAPLKVTASGLFLLTFLFEGLQSPLDHGWEAPLMPVARLFLTNLNATIGVGFLRLPLVDLLTILLVGAAIVRRRDATYVSHAPTVRPLNYALFISAGAVVGLDVLGTLQGGNFNESLWQLRQTLMFPLRTVLLLRAFDGTDRELKNIARAIIVVAVFKALIGIYYVHSFIRPNGYEIEFTTSHTDTLLFIPLLALYFNLLVERVRWKLILDGLVWLPIVIYGLVLNDRRLAYVCLGIAVIATMALSPPTMFKRLLLRAAVIAAPFLPPYVLLGWSSTGGSLFWGARLVRSLIVGDPNQGAQPDYRDIENVNVLFAWANNALIPYGFGHKMGKLFELPDISSAMPTWEYHPHNQYLWFMAIGGPIGFTLMMLPHVVAIYLCARTYAVAKEDDLWVRVWCLTGIGIVASFFCQMYGDMGTLSWTPSWMAALAAALASKLAVRTGAWPGPSQPAGAPPTR